MSSTRFKQSGISSPDFVHPRKAGRPKGSRKAKKKAKRPHGLTAIESDVTDDDNDIKSSVPPQKSSPLEIVTRLNDLVNMLEAIGDAQDIEEYLSKDKTLDTEQLKELQEVCATISTLLAPKLVTAILPSSQSKAIISKRIPSTIESYDDFFVYQAASRFLYVLKPIEVFKGNEKFDKGKVLGFVRRKGGFPLMYALPGSKECADSHPKLLDSVAWDREVKRFTDFHHYEFPNHLFDEINGQESGHTRRCHVEPRLMLWYACRQLINAIGIEKAGSTWSARIGRLGQLKDLVKNNEAEIILTKAPCKSCRKFRKRFQKDTGLKFHFSTCTLLDMQGLAEDITNMEDDVLLEKLSKIRKPDAFAERDDLREANLSVIIRGKTELATKRSREMSSDITEVTKYSYTKQTKKRSKQNTPTRKASLGVSLSDSSDDEYLPPTYTPSRKARSSALIPTSPPKKSPRLEGYSPSDIAMFGYENLEQARKARKADRKRQREQEAEMHAFLTAKRARHSGDTRNMRDYDEEEGL